ncbi:MAG: helix-turn-helix transcriptional regulator [Flavobacteriaceae bacterium]
MELDYNIISIIDILGLFQGLIFGVVLLIIGLQRKTPTLFLGLFVIFYALGLVNAILEDLGIILYYPQLETLPFEFVWLLSPLFYLYVQQLSIFSKSYPKYSILIPGIIVFILDIIIFFQSISVKQKIYDTFWYQMIEFIGVVFSIIVFLVIFIFITEHNIETKNHYTSVKYKTLRWIQIFIYASAFYFLLQLTQEILDNASLTLFISIFHVVLLYWISLNGVLQQPIKSLIPVSNKDSNTVLTERKKELKSGKYPDKELFQRIIKQVVAEELFSKPDLTIVDISKSMNVHPKSISQSINGCFHQNFNVFINSFRVEKAKTLLDSDVSNNYSIEGIGKEVGFQSKSAFYGAFKRETGTTPSNYKNRLK